MNFKLVSNYQPAGDQPEAINKLIANINNGQQHQTLLGVTGSGKTFTMANVINSVQKPTLIIAHNKTLAAQLYQEFKEFFPDNAVSYFVSYYDFYQPEAYIPKTDTYIEKETQINDEIDRLRLEATKNLMTRNDVIVVASVSAIYNLGKPETYKNSVLEFKKYQKLDRKIIIEKLIDLQYSRNDFALNRGNFRLKGETLDIWPSYLENTIRINLDTGPDEDFDLYPAKHYVVDTQKYKHIFEQIRKDAQIQEENLKSRGKIFEAHRIKSRVAYDLEMIEEVGYVNGIENYSRYFDGRNEGDPPYSLLEYFGKDYLMIIDESHITLPQIRGMYNGDRARKQTLVDYGFRLPSALDNRPLKFEEFVRRQGQTIYTSATPEEYELSLGPVVEQLVRPTGLVDPEIEIRDTTEEIKDLVKEIEERIKNKQRVLVTTITKRLAEDIADFLKDKTNIKTAYLHSDIDTMKRVEILKQLRLGEFDVLVGINLLREGIDLPEVSLVAILDADKAGFLRSKTSLIQTMGRAARHINGKVIMYAVVKTKAITEAIAEVDRRRKYQLEYNKIHNIIPTSIIKSIRETLPLNLKIDRKPQFFDDILDIDPDSLTPEEKSKLKSALEKRMRESSRILDFEGALKYRDKIKSL